MGLRDDKKEMDRKNSTTVAEDEDNDELIHEMSRLDISCVGTGSEESDDVDIDTEEEGGAKGVNKSGFIGEEYEMGYMSTKVCLKLCQWSHRASLSFANVLICQVMINTVRKFSFSYLEN